MKMEARLPLPVAVTINPILGAFMDAKFDIFKKLSDGHPLWVKAVDGLEEARDQIARLAVSSPGEYFIYSARNGRIVQGIEAADA
jgi:hypothetical protein